MVKRWSTMLILCRSQGTILWRGDIRAWESHWGSGGRGIRAEEIVSMKKLWLKQGRLIWQIIRRSVWMKLSQLSNMMKEGRQGLDSHSFVHHDGEWGFHLKCDGKPLDEIGQGRGTMWRMFLLSLSHSGCGVQNELQRYPNESRSPDKCGRCLWRK